MLLDAAETVLGSFGFDRTAYGDGKNVRARKWRWLQELKQERQRYKIRDRRELDKFLKPRSGVGGNASLYIL